MAELLSGAAYDTLNRIAANSRCLQETHVTRPFKGDVVLVLSGNRLADGVRRWRSYVDGEVRGYEVDCTHQEMLVTPAIVRRIWRLVAGQYGLD